MEVNQVFCGQDVLECEDDVWERDGIVVFRAADMVDSYFSFGSGIPSSCGWMFGSPLRPSV